VTFDQVFRHIEIEDKLRHAFRTCFAVSVLQKVQKEPENVDEGYVKLLKKVTKAIDKWTKRRKKTDFVNDEDFVERQGSPTKFDTASDFSDAFTHRNESEDFERKGSSPRGLSPGVSDEGISPASERPSGLLRPIKMIS
jgi:hypothetical protein